MYQFTIIYYLELNHPIHPVIIPESVDSLEAYPNPYQEPIGVHRSWGDINITF